MERYKCGMNQRIQVWIYGKPLGMVKIYTSLSEQIVPVGQLWEMQKVCHRLNGFHGIINDKLTKRPVELGRSVTLKLWSVECLLVDCTERDDPMVLAFPLCLQFLNNH